MTLGRISANMKSLKSQIGCYSKVDNVRSMQSHTCKRGKVARDVGKAVVLVSSNLLCKMYGVEVRDSCFRNRAGYATTPSISLCFGDTNHVTVLN